MTQHLNVARDRRRSNTVRIAAYIHFEIEAWFQAHVERGFPLDAIPEGFFGYFIREQVCALIAERATPAAA